MELNTAADNFSKEEMDVMRARFNMLDKDKEEEVAAAPASLPEVLEVPGHCIQTLVWMNFY